MRRKHKDLQDKKIAMNSPTPDSLTETDARPASDANPNHLADFTRLVDVAARKRPQGDQT